MATWTEHYAAGEQALADAVAASEAGRAGAAMAMIAVVQAASPLPWPAWWCRGHPSWPADDRRLVRPGRERCPPGPGPRISNGYRSGPAGPCPAGRWLV